MRLSDMIDGDIAEIFAKKGIENLYDIQVEPLKAVLRGENVVVAYPTASGKSLIAYTASINAALTGKKALYMVPLRALASEKFEDLRAFSRLGIKVGISTGDYDRRDERLGRNDIIVATSEKIDSLIRHRTGWMSDIGTIVGDEIHLMNDEKRGPTLEITLSKLRNLNPNAQIIALSATISNSIEIARWLGAEHFKSEWRPVNLKKGVHYGRRVYYPDGRQEEMDRAGLEGIVERTLRDGGQVIVFVSTRRYTESQAEKLASTVMKIKGETDISGIELGDDRTALRLKNCLKKGAAFHHAGLTSSQRKAVETLFRDRKISLIAATPTLAAGINLPAKTVIVRDTKRYDVSGYGWTDIPVMEVQQMLGRAGRPGYDREGDGVIIAKKPEDVEPLIEGYLLSESEPVMSRLGAENPLRTHTLALISTFGISSEEGLYSFYEKTFFAAQHPVDDIRRTLEKVLRFLFDSDLIEISRGELKPTDFGIRTSETYIDPMSAVIIRRALEFSDEIDDFGYLHTIALTPDMYPLRPKTSEIDRIYALMDDISTPINPGEVPEYAYLSAFKVALVLKEWMDEVPEKKITEKYGIWPGDLASRTELSEWLLTSTRELSRLFRPEDTHALDILIQRIHHGVKQDVLNLMRIRGIGRTRGRALHNAGFRSISDLRDATVEQLTRVEGIGKAIAEKIKEQVGGKEEKGYW